MRIKESLLAEMCRVKIDYDRRNFDLIGLVTFSQINLSWVCRVVADGVLNAC